MEGNRSTNRRRNVIALAVVTTLALGLPASAGPVHSGGPWYVGGVDYGVFNGGHYAESNLARGNTVDANGELGELRVKLKYKRNSDSAIVDLPWAQGGPLVNNFVRTAPEASVAEASQHRAYHPFSGNWSAIQQPHAY